MRLESLRERLEAYREQELFMLSPDGVRSYTIGPRSLTRYELNLKNIQDMIEKLEDEIAALESGGRRRLVVIPRDW